MSATTQPATTQPAATQPARDPAAAPPEAPRLVEPRDLDAVARALARAFQDDPCFSYFYPDPERRRRIGPAYFRVATELTLPEGHTYTGAGPAAGAACFQPPGVAAVSPLRAVRAAIRATGWGFWRFGAGPLRRALSVLHDLEALHPERPHWYLMTLGVDPERQGRGLGRALVLPVFALADASGTEVYLETFKPSNVPYYERLGFQTLKEIRPDGGRCPPGWTMLRAPRRP